MEKNYLNKSYWKFDFSMGTVLVFSHFSERIMPPYPPPRLPQFVKLLISIVEKKDLNENYVEFDFSMGIVLVVFSLF